ncbi:hypothetical protein ACILG0_05150 [Pseudomonadota bacterium AL_CKDN230030165-1A_HGKHYDSX7]
MSILIAFSPFIAFVIVERLLGVGPGLIAGALVSALLLLRDALSRDRKIKILEAGTFVLFAALAAYARVAGADTWPIAAVRLRVDAGLLLIVLISMAVRQPFTLQYAREQTAPDVWRQPGFIRTNYVITAVWAGAFALMVLADLLLVYRPDLPHAIAIGVTIAALYGAMTFTTKYAQRAGRARGPAA